MGVPAFYRWLVSKYPKVVANAIQHPTLDATSPNPNGIEFDNLYLDMNGIIHPCFHPEDRNDFQPSCFKEVFNSVFEYVDRLFNIVRPRKLLYFAIDGVAPRAKMNQQRARRFQAAHNNKIAEEEEERLRIKYEKEGKRLLPKVKSELDDSNIITPGTEFMYELSKALQVYIQTRLKEDPAWKNIKVIISDSNVPGEGEHKIMSFIRSQRSLPGYDVNTRHCLHGLDADLIMLALATHELHFSILREDVLAKKDEQPHRTPTSYQDRDGSSAKPSGSCKSFPVKKTCSYQFLHIWILREYLELDMKASDVPEGFKFDNERAIDDFIFMCFFVGNDFLPHLPSLEIHEGALDLLMTVYKRDFKSLGGYIVDAQRVNERKAPYLKLKRVERLVFAVGSYEEQIFKKRTEIRERKMRRVLNELSASRDEEVNEDGADIDIPIVNVSLHLDSCGDKNDNMLENTKKMKEEVKKVMSDKADIFKTGLLSADKIKYGTHGWKERYYRVKFGTEDHCKLESIKKAVLKEYTEGLCWVLLYYFTGVPSWTWFYPYHYGPCASDMKGLGQNRVNFQEGFPFEPFDQLMAVLPPRSADALPKAYRDLMEDEGSDLSPFYPQDFKVDIDGKRFLWQGHCLLPFIDEKRLLSSTRKAKEELKEYEIQRNLIKNDLLFVTASSAFGSQLLTQTDESPSDTNGLVGFVYLNVHTLDSTEEEKRILCVDFASQQPRMHVPRILENVDIPPRTVHESDIEETVLWHEQNGSFGRVHRVPNQARYVGVGLPEIESSGLVGGSGWRGRGRGRGFSGPNPRQQEAYNHHHHHRPSGPNPYGNPRPSSSSSPRPYVRPHTPPAFGPQRAMPPPPGIRPRLGNNMNYYHPEASAWSPPQLENLRVSAPRGRGFGRGRADNQGRGRGQFRPTTQHS